MNRIARTAACAWIAVFVACAAPRHASKTPEPSEPRAYENREVGIRVTLPAGWEFVSNIATERDARARFEERTDRSADERFAMEHSHVLFSMVDVTAPAREDGLATSSFTCLVEEFDAKFRALDSKGYAVSAARGPRMSDAPVEFLEMRETKLAGRPFVLLPSIQTYGGTRWRRDSYFHAEDGRGTLCVAVYPEKGPAPRAALDAIEPAR